MGDNESSSSPLGQRQSSRKARRAARANTDATPTATATATLSQEQQQEPPVQEEAADLAPLPTRKQKGPSDEIEKRIAERIEKRKASNIVAAANEEIYKEEETEILGTYEYHDHTADIQIHAMGRNFQDAIEQLALGMFGYMTKVSLVEINRQDSQEYGSNVKVEAHDPMSLVFAFLQEWLSIFHENHFVPRKVTVRSVELGPNNWTVVSSGEGETMKPNKHIQGTEVKAVTYSNLQVIGPNDEDGSYDIWVILDI